MCSEGKLPSTMHGWARRMAHHLKTHQHVVAACSSPWRFTSSEFQKEVKAVLHICAAQGHETIVLGVWGCSSRKVSHVVGAFQKELLHDGEFAAQFQRVIFAIHDSTMFRDFKHSWNAQREAEQGECHIFMDKIAGGLLRSCCLCYRRRRGERPREP